MICEGEGVQAMTRSNLAAVATGLVGILFVGSGSPVRACKMLPPERHWVPGHLEVSVETAGKPSPGIVIVVERLNETSNDYELVAQSVTEKDGLARFEHLQTGRYSVRTSQPAGNDGLPDVVVTNNTRKPREERLTLRWPALRVVHAKNLRGTLASLGEPEEPSVSLSGIKVSLLEAYSGKDVGSQITEADGGFAFSGLPPGLYFARLTEGSGTDVLRPWGRHDVGGYIAVELNPIDKDASDIIALEIGMSSCDHLIYTAA